VTLPPHSVQIATTAKTIKEEFKPDLIVAIGGGGFYPARVLRTYLKVPSKVDPAKQRNIPIQAIGLSLYEGESFLMRCLESMMGVQRDEGMERFR